MKIKLIKYSKEESSIVLILDSQASEIHITDCNNVDFNVIAKTETQIPGGYVYYFSSANSNLTNGASATPNKDSLFYVKAISVDTATDIIAAYDHSEFSTLKKDMLFAINDTGDTVFYRHLVKLTFLELAMNDMTKEGGSVEDSIAFYKEMLNVRDMFKAKYHYNDSL
jgi:hypothetical protein